MTKKDITDTTKPLAIAPTGPRLVYARSGPLRKIVAEGVNEHGGQTETLECGHTILRKQDLMGPTNAARRRCRKCKKEAALNE